MAKSMTIDEMRALHHRAVSEAEAKRTELRLVLASRYRELVGSSDEVIKMKERAQELFDLVQNLPELMEKVAKPTFEESKLEPEAPVTVNVETQLSEKLRVLHRALDAQDVFLASVSLVDMFTIIARQTDAFELANTLSREPANLGTAEEKLQSYMRMIYLNIQSLPEQIQEMSDSNLAQLVSADDESFGAKKPASALAALNCFYQESDKADFLLNKYFDSKAKLLQALLGQLQAERHDTAEEILSKIVLILQFDIIVHPYQIFVIRKSGSTGWDTIVRSLPMFDKDVVKAKCSKYVLLDVPS